MREEQIARLERALPFERQAIPEIAQAIGDLDSTVHGRGL
jgi:hypothetical protein